MRNPWQRFCDGFDDLGTWNQFGLTFIAAVLLLCTSLQVLA